MSSILIYNQFLLDTREALGDIVPANMLDDTIAAVAKCLENYELSLFILP